MKTAVITGGSGGIGKAVATALAKKQYRIILHGHNEAKTRAALEEVRHKSGNPHVESILADVSTIRGMKDLAAQIREKADSIEALVLSMGVILPSQTITSDGLELGFAIQYLSRFAVTVLLMEELRKGHARIVQVAAPVLPFAKIHFDNIALKEEFTMVKAMAQEMFANHLFIQEFAKRIPASEMVINGAHVGVAKTGITRFSNFFFKLAVNLFGSSPEKAAKNFVYLASDDSVNFSGYFLKMPGHPEKKEKVQHDEEDAERLWNLSMNLISPAK